MCDRNNVKNAKNPRIKIVDITDNFYKLIDLHKEKDVIEKRLAELRSKMQVIEQKIAVSKSEEKKQI
jgi:hypothetical protein